MAIETITMQKMEKIGRFLKKKKIKFLDLKETVRGNGNGKSVLRSSALTGDWGDLSVCQCL